MTTGSTIGLGMPGTARTDAGSAAQDPSVDGRRRRRRQRLSRRGAIDDHHQDPRRELDAAADR